MQKRMLVVLGILLTLVVSFWLTNTAISDRCGFSPMVNLNTRYERFCKQPNPPIDCKKYLGVKSYNFNISLTTNAVIPKALKIKANLLSQIPNLSIENFSMSETSGSMNLRVPHGQEHVIIAMFENDPEVSSFSSNINNYGTSYLDAALNYHTYKYLLAHYGQLKTAHKSPSPVDDEVVLSLLKQQMESHQSTMNSYESQLGNDTLYINISAKPKK